MKLHLPRGMRDFPPEEKLRRDELIDTLRATFERYGFNPLDTPVVERWEILSAKYAGGEEILKETFRLQDQGGRKLGLRYDLTTPLARYVGMHPTIKKPFKRYQIGTVYRDGPVKKGRAREFIQCDADTVGTDAVLADAECLVLALDVFEQLGLEVELRVNHRQLLLDLARCGLGASGERGMDFVLSLDKLEKLGQEGVLAELSEKGFERSQVERVFSWLEVSGDNRERLARLVGRFPAGEVGVWAEALERVFALVDDPRVRFVPSLARGLGYYTGTIFEAFLADGAFPSALAAGGRYDEMIGRFLGHNERVPAVGISFGVEPILTVLGERSSRPARRSVVQVYVIPIRTQAACWQVLRRLRAAGIHADMDLSGRGPTANLKYAHAYGIPYALIVGPDELAGGVVTLRDLVSGQEEKLPFEAALARLKAGL